MKRNISKLHGKLCRAFAVAVSLTLAIALCVPAQALGEVAAGFDPTAGSASPQTLGSDDGVVSVPGVKVNLFNYPLTINDDTDPLISEALYKFTNSNGSAVDGNGMNDTLAERNEGKKKEEQIKLADIMNLKPTMAAMLGGHGYPEVVYNSSNYSMEVLFGENSPYLVGSMNDGGGLFKAVDINEGDAISKYFFYDSAVNAAYYNDDSDDNPTTGSFVLYDRPLANNHIPTLAWDTVDTYHNWSNFMPFNELTSDTVQLVNVCNEAGNVMDTEVYQLKNQEKLGSDRTVLNDMWFGMTVEYDFFMPVGGMQPQIGDDGKVATDSATGKVLQTPMIFDFHGDDDVVVYIDGVLVLDISGTHEAKDGYIDFSTGEVLDPSCFVDEEPVVTENTNNEAAGTFYEKSADGLTVKKVVKTADTITTTVSKGTPTTLYQRYVEALGAENIKEGLFANVDSDPEPDTFADYSEHNFKFFYLERGGNISYCRLKYNMPIITSHLEVMKEVPNATENGDAEYTFVLYEDEANASGGTSETTSKPAANMQYYITDANGNDIYGTTTNEGVLVPFATDSEGSFKLKAGETATFLLEYQNANEFVSKSYHAQEVGADGTVKAASCKTIKTGWKTLRASGNPYVSEVVELRGGDDAAVTFTNAVRGDLSISKQVTGAVSESSQSASWSFDVILTDKDGVLAEIADTQAAANNSGQAVGAATEVTFPLEGDHLKGSNNSITFEKLPASAGESAAPSTYKASVTLASGQSVKIKDLPIGVEYNVTEVDAGTADNAQDKGYITFITEKDASSGSDINKAIPSATGSIASDTQAAFTNSYIAPTEVTFAANKTLVEGSANQDENGTTSSDDAGDQNQSISEQNPGDESSGNADDDKLSLGNMKFKFQLSADENAPMPEDGKSVIEVSNNVNGDVSFGAIKYDFSNIGKEYTYTLSEVNDGNSSIGYDATIYTAKVKVDLVTNEETRAPEASATVQITESDGTVLTEEEVAQFVNTYTVPAGSFTLEALKILEGATLKDEEFEFALEPLNGAPMPASTIVANDESGTVSFGSIAVAFEDADKLGRAETDKVVYEYKISEVKGGDPLISYDTEEALVTVAVTKNADNELVPNVTYKKGEGEVSEEPATFTNGYQTPTLSFSLNAVKQLKGAVLSEGDFVFQLKPLDGAPMPKAAIDAEDEGDKATSIGLEGDAATDSATGEATEPEEEPAAFATNAADGSVIFESIEMLKADADALGRGEVSSITYSYAITELPGTAQHMNYDEGIIVATVTITLNGDGKLVASTSYTKQGGAVVDEMNTFLNVFAPPTPDVMVDAGDSLPVVLLAGVAFVAALAAVVSLIMMKRRCH